jgi:uncharacterized protein
MSYIIICATALLVSGLTLFSGFGLGTILMPAFAVFFPIEVAVAATAVVHGTNNIFKMIMVGRHADYGLVLRFGVPAMIAALAGAAVLSHVAGFDPLATYTIVSKTAVITPIKLVMSLLIFIFALFELLPTLQDLRFDRKFMPLGGLLSGFFGGLSGHQGALRSAFLTKAGVSPQAFVGTNAFIGFMVDMARIAAYGALLFTARQTGPIGPDQWPLVLSGTFAAFAGVVFGKRFLHKITMKTVQSITGAFLLFIALALGSGLV